MTFLIKIKKYLFLGIMLSNINIASGVTIVTPGKVNCYIELGKAATATEKYAAEELINTIYKMTGMQIASSKKQIPIIIGSPKTNKHVAEYSKKLGLSSTKGVIVVCYTDGKLFLAGDSSSNALYAVYTFLDLLGVRWYWPGEDGEFIPPKKIITIDDNLLIKESPALPLRGLHIMTSSPETEIWMARNRMNYIRSSPNAKSIKRRRKLGFYITVAGHSVAPNKKDFKGHPEYYALVNGKRRINIPRPHACWSNKDVIKYFSDRTVKHMKKYDIDMYQLYPSDSLTYCECADCIKYDRCTTWHNFLKKVSDNVRKEIPGAKIGTLAYQGYLPLPKRDTKYLNYLEFCMYGRCYRHTFEENCTTNENELKSLAKWLKTGTPVTIRGYECDVYRPEMFLPLGYLIDDQIKKFKNLKVNGYFTEACPYDRKKFNSFRLTWYILGRLAWNADESYKTITSDWCKNIFGPAADDINKYYSLMESYWRKLPGHISYYSHNPGAASLKMLNPGRIKTIKKLFDMAQESIKKLPKQQQDRILKQINLERSLFNTWGKTHNKYSGKNYGVSFEIPQRDFKGKINELPEFKAWEKSASLPGFLDKSGKPAVNRTTVDAFHTDKSLFLKVTSYEKDMKRVRYNCRKRDGKVYSDECVEMFIKVPDQPPGQYYHMAVNSAGIKYDAVGTGGMKFNKKWDPEWKSLVEFKKDHWVCYIELPFSEFGGKPLERAGWDFTIKHTRGIRRDISHSGFPDASYHNMDALIKFKFVKELSPTQLIFTPGMKNKNLPKELRQLQLAPVCISDKKDLQTKLAESSNKLLFMRIHSSKKFVGDAFFKEYISPWIKRGGIIVISAASNISPEKWLENNKLKVKRHNKVVSSTKVKSSTCNWTSSKYNLEKYVEKKRPNNAGFYLEYPAAWTTLAGYKDKEYSKYAWLFTTKYGKGWLVVTTASIGNGGGIRAFCGDSVVAGKLLKNLSCCLKDTE